MILRTNTRDVRMDYSGVQFWLLASVHRVANGDCSPPISGGSRCEVRFPALRSAYRLRTAQIRPSRRQPPMTLHGLVALAQRSRDQFGELRHLAMKQSHTPIPCYRSFTSAAVLGLRQFQRNRWSKISCASAAPNGLSAGRRVVARCVGVQLAIGGAVVEDSPAMAERRHRAYCRRDRVIILGLGRFLDRFADVGFSHLPSNLLAGGLARPTLALRRR